MVDLSFLQKNLQKDTRQREVESSFHQLFQGGVGAEGCPRVEAQPRYPGGCRIWSGAAGVACQPSAISAHHLQLCLGSGHPARTLHFREQQLEKLLNHKISKFSFCKETDTCPVSCPISAFCFYKSVQRVFFSHNI